jgi:hypothetical protein
MEDVAKEVRTETTDVEPAPPKTIGELRIGDLSDKSAKPTAKKSAALPKLGLGVRG